MQCRTPLFWAYKYIDPQMLLGHGVQIGAGQQDSMEDSDNPLYVVDGWMDPASIMQYTKKLENIQKTTKPQ